MLNAADAAHIVWLRVAHACRYGHPNLVNMSEVLLTPDHVIITMDW